MFIIYCAVCIENNKKYIGQSSRTLYEVKRRHENNATEWPRTRIRGGSVYFFRALMQHGFHNFCWGVIDTAESREEAYEKETGAIRSHQTIRRDYGYNILEEDGPRPTQDGLFPQEINLPPSQDEMDRMWKESISDDNYTPLN